MWSSSTAIVAEVDHLERPPHRQPPLLTFSAPRPVRESGSATQPRESEVSRGKQKAAIVRHAVLAGAGSNLGVLSSAAKRFQHERVQRVQFLIWPSCIFVYLSSRSFRRYTPSFDPLYLSH